MPVYQADDPFAWKLIQAAQAGLNPDGTTKYELPYGMGSDPEFLAFQTQYDLGRTQAAADAELRKRQAQDAYEQALRSLEQQGLTSARDTDTSLLSRGVFNSGERLNRQDDLRKALTEGRSNADTQYVGQLGTIDSDLNRALTQLNMERERQIVASQARIAEAQRQGAIEAGLLGGSATSGGGGGGTGSAPAATTTATRTPDQQASAQRQAAAVQYSQTYQNPGGGRGAYGPVNAKPTATQSPRTQPASPSASQAAAMYAKPPAAKPKVVRY